MVRGVLGGVGLGSRQHLACWAEEPKLDLRALGTQKRFRKGRDECVQVGW